MKKLLFVFIFTFLCIVSNAQSPYYYYYEGKKIYLSLNTEYAFLSLKEQNIPTDIKQHKIKVSDLQSDKSDRKQYKIQLNVTDLPAGIYYLHVGKKDKTPKIKTIIVSR
jgi:hypothetical protein